MENGTIEQINDTITADLMKRMGASDEVAALCEQTVASQANGDICLGPLEEVVRQRLLASPVVTQEPQTAPQPFVLDGNYLYTRRNWLYKQTILDRIRAMSQHQLEEINIPEDAIYAQMEERQREGIKTMCGYQFSILTGGPGTGKTFTIARAVKLIQEKYKDIRLGLAAPTGKAAARIKEAMKQEAEKLALQQIPDATTLHSLLQSNYDLVTFKHNHNNPLPLDWLIIDEASMIALPLMAKLLDALAPETRLTLVGDANQLASVEAGRVFGDLCKIKGIQKCELTISKRFAPGETIDSLAHAINEGDSAKALEILHTPNTVVHYTPLPANLHADKWPGFSELIQDKFKTFASQTTAEGALQALNDCRILCALRKGPYGMEHLNDFIQKTLKESSPHPVMILQNDHSLDVNNGDVGIVINETQEMQYLYLTQNDGAIRKISLELLPNTELAFASTVHKAQGSEYQNVIIVLPPAPNTQPEAEANPLLTRELLYTAITRTKGDVFIFGGDETIKCCCEKAITRNTGGFDITQP